jgi:putative component of membrane protein insertase Oxa1/YidC/SpoIIIJ protein YidD
MINRVFIFILRGTRPLLGPARCKFTVTCTEYAIIQLQEKSLLVAIGEIVRRLFSCNPFW